MCWVQLYMVCSQRVRAHATERTRPDDRRRLAPRRYTLTFGAIVCNIAHVILATDTASALIDLLAGVALGDDEAQFLVESYQPELIAATAGVKLGPLDRLTIGLRGVGTAGKMLWAFLWQEEQIPGPHITSKPLNALAARVQPGLTSVMNALTGYPIYDETFQTGENAFPGHQECRVQEPHSKWQEMSGLGLVDLMMLCDDVHRMSSAAGKDEAVVWTPPSEGTGWLGFWTRWMAA